MRIRLILSVIAIISLGIVFIQATQSEGQRIRQAYSNIVDSDNQKALSNDEENSLDFIKEEFDAGNIIATKYISSPWVIDKFLSKWEGLGEKLEALIPPLLIINFQTTTYPEHMGLI